MNELSPVLRRLAGEQVAFWCPGCKDAHVIGVGPGGWTWDGNAEAPTFAPSVLVRAGHYADGKRGEEHGCWCDWNAAHPDDPTRFACVVCHSFVRQGRIEFLSDSTHALAGQTVPLASWPERVP